MYLKFTGQREAVRYDREVQSSEGAVYVLRDRCGDSIGIGISCSLAV